MKYDLLKKRSEPFIKFCQENRKTLVLLCAAVLLIGALQIFSAAQRGESFVKDKNGKLTAVRAGDEKTRSVPLKIQAERNGVKTDIEVMLSFSEEGETPSGGETAVNPEEELGRQIRNLVRNLENSSGDFIRLPEKLEDGTRLLWYSNETSSGPAILMLLPLSAAALYQSQKSKEKEKDRRKLDGIRKDLPGFNSKLLLLLNSGLILNDAFLRIADGFSQREDPGYLGHIIADIRRQSQEAGSSLVNIIESYSRTLGIREFSRLAGIIADNQHKGVNLTDKLESESDLLWNQRKKLAEEKGRAAETKLAFPLALLLLVLILVTAAPAMLQM